MQARQVPTTRPGGPAACPRCAARSRSETAAHEVQPGKVNDVLGTGGQALDPALRRWFEPRFGRDFSQVRVHADARAAASARAVGAAAYTAGQHIVFGHQRYRPDSAPGRHLLAHELAHVAQHAHSGNAAGREWNRVTPQGASSEHEADRAADAVMAGQGPAPVLTVASGAPGAISRRVEPSSDSPAADTAAGTPAAVPATAPAASAVRCTAGVNGAPANSEARLQRDRMSAILAVTLAQADLTSLHLEALMPGVGAGGGFTMPTGPKAQAYRSRFGRPPSAGSGRFRNRLSGDTFPSRAQALVEEAHSLSDRYNRINALLGDSSFEFRCIPNPTPANDCGANCATRDAFGCPSVIMLCPSFWGLNPDQGSQLLIHEAAHSAFNISHGHNFRHADCYAAFAADARGLRSTSFPVCEP